jgi:hypothetical protein
MLVLVLVLTKYPMRSVESAGDQGRQALYSKIFYIRPFQLYFEIFCKACSVTTGGNPPLACSAKTPEKGGYSPENGRAEDQIARERYQLNTSSGRSNDPMLASWKQPFRMDEQVVSTYDFLIG